MLSSVGAHRSTKGPVGANGRMLDQVVTNMGTSVVFGDKGRIQTIKWNGLLTAWTFSFCSQIERSPFTIHL